MFSVEATLERPNGPPGRRPELVNGRCGDGTEADRFRLFAPGVISDRSSAEATARILYAPGEAGNAGGVATGWRFRLYAMKDLHANCIHLGQKDDGCINYVDGANIAGFVTVADAMLAQGVIRRRHCRLAAMGLRLRGINSGWERRR